MPTSEHTLTRLLRKRGHHLSDPSLFARARAEALAAEVAMPDNSYPPESIRVLDGLKSRKPGIVVGTGPEHWWASIDGLAPEPVALWRDAGAEQDPPQPWGAERVGHEGVLWPDRDRLIARAIPPADELRDD